MVIALDYGEEVREFESRQRRNFFKKKKMFSGKMDRKNEKTKYGSEEREEMAWYGTCRKEKDAIYYKFLGMM